jgi:hypothetical protein
MCRAVSFLAAFLVLVVSAVAQVVTVGDGVLSIGKLNTYNPATGQTLNLSAVMRQALLQSQLIQILQGNYTIDAPTSVMADGTQIRISNAATLTMSSTNTSSVGFLNLSGRSGCLVEGGIIIHPYVVANQAVIKLSSGFRNRITNAYIKFTEAPNPLTGIGTGSASTPQFGILADDESESLFEFNQVVPVSGVICFRDKLGVGNAWNNCRVSSGLNVESTDSFFVAPNCVYGFESYDSQFTILRDFRGEQLGTVVQGEIPALIHWYGSGAETEEGHSIIDSPHAELICAQNYILVEGVQGWLTIENANLGLSNYGIGTLGHAGIRITRSTDVTSKLSSLNATNANGRLTLATGTWGSTIPAVGAAVLTSGFVNAANNGTFYIKAVEAPAGVPANSTWIQLATFVSGSTLTTATLTDETGNGDETVKISRQSARVVVQNSFIHNICRSRGTAEGLFAIANLAQVATNTGINVTGANTFHKASGSWTVTPTAGQWIRTTDFTDVANNGNYKVVSSDNDDITVAQTLVNETGGGDEDINGAFAYEGSSIWVEYANDVDIRNCRITDVRGQWGVSIDTATVRGVVLDGLTIQKGSGAGAVAPIRMPTGTLSNTGSGVDYDDCEGVGIGTVWLKSWGTSVIPVGSATVSILLAASAPTITTTNAQFFNGLLGDNTTSYEPAGAADTAEKLSGIRVLDK